MTPQRLCLKPRSCCCAANRSEAEKTAAAGRRLTEGDQMPMEASPTLSRSTTPSSGAWAAHYVEAAHANCSWAQVRWVFLGETSAGRGDRYVTNVLDAIHEAKSGCETKSGAGFENGIRGEILNAPGIWHRLPPLVNRRFRPRDQLSASTRTPKTFPLYYLLFEGNIQRRSSMLYQ